MPSWEVRMPVAEVCLFATTGILLAESTGLDRFDATFCIFPLPSQLQDKFLQRGDSFSQHVLYGNPDAFQNFFGLSHQDSLKQIVSFVLQPQDISAEFVLTQDFAFGEF